MKNDYEIRGDVTAIFVNRRSGEVVETLISTSQLKRANEYPNSWFARYNKSTKSFYIYGTMPGSKGKDVALHRWIMGLPTGMEVDHINHNTLDNRSENLRLLTISENQQNRRGPRQGSASGVRGVVWHKHSGTWNVQLRVDRKKLSFGYYKDIKEAEAIAIEARLKHMPFASEAV